MRRRFAPGLVAGIMAIAPLALLAGPVRAVGDGASTFWTSPDTARNTPSPPTANRPLRESGRGAAVLKTTTMALWRFTL